MTSINFVLQPNRLVAIADGAVYGTDAVVTGFASKIQSIPHLQAVVATKGRAWGASVLAHEFGFRARSFEDLAENAEAIVHAATDLHADLLNWEPPGEIYLAGWSSERRRPELYAMTFEEESRIERSPGVFAEVGELVDLSHLEDLTNEIDFEEYVARVNPDRTTPSRIVDVETYAIRLIDTLRQKKRTCTDVEGLEAYLIGGHVQVMIVDANGTSSRIVHRFPDKVGELIKPAPIDWTQRRAPPRLGAVETTAGMSKLQRDILERKQRKARRA